MPKVLFTDMDIYAYKKALALHAAKNNALIDKWTKALEITKQDIDELYTCKPSDERTWRIRSKESVLVDIQIFLDDLRKPCDSFISDFEFKNFDDSVYHKRIAELFNVCSVRED